MANEEEERERREELKKRLHNGDNWWEDADELSRSF